MSEATLREALAGVRALVLDTSAILAYLSGTEPVSEAAALVIDRFVGIDHPATVSAVTVTEVLVRPFRSTASARATAETFLTSFPGLRVRPVDYEVAREAARVRAVTGLRAPDAIIIATAIDGGMDAVVANDDRWGRAIAALDVRLRLVHLKAHVPL